MTSLINTPDPVCPHCDYISSNAWKWDDDVRDKDESSGERECEGCGRTYLWSCRVITRWSTRPLPPTPHVEPLT